jgi:cytosine deaminase
LLRSGRSETLGPTGENDGSVVSFALVNATLPSGEEVDLQIDGGQISSVAPGAGSLARDRLDAEGGLVLPAFVDTHLHLDKVLIRDLLPEHDGTLRGAIDSIHEAKRHYTVEEVRSRAIEVIRASAMTGTTRIRSHVDVDTIGGLVPLRGVLAAARACSYFAEVRTVAFPQEGILRDPGTADLMVEAMQTGADIVGGMPHWEYTEDEQREHVRICFEIAEQFDADVDMHVDETDDGSIRTLAMLAEETVKRRWQGRVTAGHVCSLSAADDEYAARVIKACREADISIASNPVTNLVLQGRGDRGLVRRGTTRIKELMAAGVNVVFGQDCVNDGFYPFGRGDMLEVALISAHAAHLTTYEEQLATLRAVTDGPARAWRLGAGYGVERGARADLQLFAASTWPEVLRLQDPPSHVWHSGRLVARTTITRELLG